MLNEPNGKQDNCQPCVNHSIISDSPVHTLHLRPILAHAAFVLWLMAFPYEGVLVATSDLMPSLFFLVPHACAMFVLSRLAIFPWFSRMADICIILVMCATLFFPYFQDLAGALLIVTGIWAAVLPIRLGLLHAAASRPALSAALGQCLGIGLLVLLPLFSLPIPAQFILIALPLLLFYPRSFGRIALEEVPIPQGAMIFFRALPIIFLFYMTSGLNHGLLLPFYTHVGMLPGLELAFYVLGILIGFRLGLCSLHIPLAMAIVLAMFALGLWQSPDVIAVDISMYAMHLSKGFADIFLLALMLSQRDVMRAFALGIGVMLLGMSGGIYLAAALGQHAWSFVLVGNILLCATVLIFFLLTENTVFSRAASAQVALLPKAEAQEQESVKMTCPSQGETILPLHEPAFMASLSRQEHKVLEQILGGANYKQAAQNLHITESSVKTYMSRVCSKADVRNKAQLMQTFFNNQ